MMIRAAGRSPDDEAGIAPPVSIPPDVTRHP